MSETPRTDKNRFHSDIGGWVCYSSLCRQIERELNEASERIKRMESAGDALEYASVISEAGEDPNGFEKLLIAQREWRKAKEAKP